MTEWQKIKSAPKNGTPILAIINWDVGNKDDRQVEIIEWDEEEGDWFTPNGGWFRKAHIHATHWMPLPEIPND
jgi:hypothetical protein